MRFGVGGDFPKGRQVDYVLGEFTDEERKAMPDRLKLFGDAILAFSAIGPDRTMNSYNGK
jgi:PTH1 family peptidyl-tRNA hydrolase